MKQFALRFVALGLIASTLGACVVAPYGRGGYGHGHGHHHGREQGGHGGYRR